MVKQQGAWRALQIAPFFWPGAPSESPSSAQLGVSTAQGGIVAVFVGPTSLGAGPDSGLLLGPSTKLKPVGAGGIPM